MVTFPNTYLEIAIWTHIALGAIAAFVLCPLAVFAKKGSKWHRKVGRLYVGNVILICLSGIAVLVGPAFLDDYWKQESAAKGFGEIFHASDKPTMFFLFLLVMFTYMSLSAIRLWSRIGYGAADRISSNALDWLLAAVMGAFSVGFLIIGIEDLISHIKFATTFLGGGLLMLCFVAFDVYTFVAKPAVKRFPWWVLHMTKLFYAWAGLLDAFWLRLRVFVLPIDMQQPLIGIGTPLWIGMTALGFVLYRKSMADRY
jgi:hypothetical protein